jgi:hypothetical protein
MNSYCIMEGAVIIPALTSIEIFPLIRFILNSCPVQGQNLATYERRKDYGAGGKKIKSAISPKLSYM